MKAAIVFTGGGPLAVLTAYDSLEDPDLVRRLEAKGFYKYMAFEVPLDEVRQCYGAHYQQIVDDYTQPEELKILDEDGNRIFRMIPFADFGPGIAHEERNVRTQSVRPEDPAAMI
ncbi:MAG: hypothetical protein ACM33T_07705 [Solirubrobacterales bacterium]